MGAAARFAARVADRRGAGTEVEVTFAPEGPGSRVELEHRGWDGADRPAGRYANGWEVVLATFIERREGLDADVDRLPGRAVAQERGDELGEPARREQLIGGGELLAASTSGWRSRTRMRAAPR